MDGLPKGLAIANLPEVPQEFSPRVDKALKSNVKDLMKYTLKDKKEQQNELT